MYVLIKAVDTQIATQWLHEEPIQNKSFDILRKEWAENFNSIVEKLSPVPVDVSCQNLGVHDFDLRSDMWREIDIIVSSAATTKFDERYDIALAVNAFAAKHVAEFAVRCVNIKMLLHVSTAYVRGNTTGIIQEKAISMGETPNGSRKLDVKEEKLLVEELMNELREKNSLERKIIIALKNLGLQRARLHGWPNTYSLTKAMGEMMQELSNELFCFSGNIRGHRTIDSIAILFGRGRLKYFLSNPSTILDTKHPLTYSDLRDIIVSYFKDSPWINEDGKPVKVRKPKIVGIMASFHKHVRRYILLSKVLKVDSSGFGGYFQGLRADRDEKVNAIVRLADLYGPYIFFNGVFDDTNTMALRATTFDNGVNLESVFYFDPRCINWEDYFERTHLPKPSSASEK
ncbi:hypothetical protein BT93_H0870 [Corymbia citriodora subsp. variegata]|nr:hypothetical protein BT93_H0870 [Corymbia citriodora subsp. variegata]